MSDDKDYLDPAQNPFIPLDKEPEKEKADIVPAAEMKEAFYKCLLGYVKVFVNGQELELSVVNDQERIDDQPFANCEPTVLKAVIAASQGVDPYLSPVTNPLIKLEDE